MIQFPEKVFADKARMARHVSLQVSERRVSIGSSAFASIRRGPFGPAVNIKV